MIPLVIVYQKESQFNSYLEKEFLKKNKISPSSTFKIYPLKEEITIDQIREVKKIVNIKTQAEKLFVFYSFHKASIEAQNAFLKILEEKGEDNYFLMGVALIHQILPTVLSRSRIINLNKTVYPDEEKNKIDIKNIFKSSFDYPFFADKNFVVESKDQAKKIITALIFKLSDLQKKNKDLHLSLLITKGIELLKLLEDNNLSTQLTVDNYLIFIKKRFNIKK